MLSIAVIGSMNTFSQTSLQIQELKITTEIKEENPFIQQSEEQIEKGCSTTNFLFRLYKRHISSQDHGVCHFKPSCSEYGLIATQKQGLFIGIINTLDRLNRCSGNNERLYPTADEEGYYLDEVRNIFYEKLP